MFFPPLTFTKLSHVFPSCTFTKQFYVFPLLTLLTFTKQCHFFPSWTITKQSHVFPPLTITKQSHVFSLPLIFSKQLHNYETFSKWQKFGLKQIENFLTTNVMKIFISERLCEKTLWEKEKMLISKMVMNTGHCSNSRLFALCIIM